MPTVFSASRQVMATVTGAAALAIWASVLIQAAPRWTAGPLCGGQSTLLSLAGHCPACWSALAFSLLFVMIVRTRPATANRVASRAIGRTSAP